MKEKIIGIFVIMLFFGTGVLPVVSGNVVNINATDMNNSTRGNTKSTHVVFFIIGLIKDKQKINSSYNFYRFITVLGLCLYIDILAHPSVLPILWINYDTGLLYDFKIGFFGDNFVCAAFFVPRYEIQHSFR
jgi:hypothetical protein